MDTFTHDGLVFDVSDRPPDNDGNGSGSGDGGGAEAPVVVLLHGWPQDHTAWDRVAPLLAAAGMRTLAPDLRGYSPGARPLGRLAYAMSALVSDVDALLDAAGVESAHIVGHDWGGALAWAFATARPERVATLTVLSTPHPSAMQWAFRHGDQARRSWYMLAFQLPVLPELVLARQLPVVLRRIGLPQQDVDRYAARQREPGALSASLNWYRGIPVSRGLLGSVRRRGGAAPAQGPRPTVPGRTITVPTTYLWGARDPALGRAAAERTGTFVSADYRFVELAAGHWLPEKQPDAVAAAITERVRGLSPG